MSTVLPYEKSIRLTQKPTILSANLLYLTAMMLVLFVGSFVQSRSFSWGLLFAELGLILLPTLLWLRNGRLPWRETVRFNWPGWPPILWSLLIGVGLWLLDSWLGAIMTILMGYNVLPSAGIYPTTVRQALLVFIAFTVAAPVGEELLFRGYMQPAYERHSPRTAVLVVGILFALFHLSLLGLPPRLPLAFALGYVVWRSNSLLPGITMHLANNALASLLLICIGFNAEFMLTLPIGTAPATLVGLLLALLGLWALRRVTPLPPDNLPAAAPSRGWLARTWPLLLAGMIWLGVAGLELTMGRAPQLLAFGQALELTENTLPTAQHHYALHNVVGETVGEGVCEYKPDSDSLTLACTFANDAFEVRQDSSLWSSDKHSMTLEATWETAAANLISARIKIDRESSYLTTTATRQDGGMEIDVSNSHGGESSTTVDPPLLLDNLWPWRLSALPFAPGLVRKTTIVYPSRWDPEMNQNVLTVTETAVVVHGVEPVTTPAGSFQVWRVSIDDKTAWYQVEAPHTLVKYDDGFLTYLLTKGTEGVTK